MVIDGLTIAADPKRLGARIGITAVLSRAAPTQRDHGMAPPTSWLGSLSPPGSSIGR
jgi:hypothetical protein